MAEGNSLFCWPETVGVSQGEAEDFIKYQKSKKWQTKANYKRKYMIYFTSRINDVKFNLESNNVNSVQRSRLYVMAHVVFFLIHRWITRCLPLALMRGRQSYSVTLTWYTLDQWNTWKGELWLLVYNNSSYLWISTDNYHILMWIIKF